MIVMPAVTLGDFKSWESEERCITKSGKYYKEIFLETLKHEQINHVLLAIDQRNFRTLYHNHNLKQLLSIPDEIKVIIDHGIFVPASEWEDNKSPKEVIDLYSRNNPDFGMGLDYPVNMLDDMLEEIKQKVLLDKILENNKLSENKIKSIILERDKLSIPFFFDHIYDYFDNYFGSETINPKMLSSGNLVKTTIFKKPQIGRYGITEKWYKSNQDILIDQTIKSFKEMTEIYYENDRDFKLMPVIQSYDRKTTLKCLEAYRNISDKYDESLLDYLAIGTAGKTSQSYEERQKVIEVSKATRDYLAHHGIDSWVHVLGVAQRDLITKLRKYGVNSADSTKFIKMGIGQKRPLKYPTIFDDHLVEHKINSKLAINIIDSCNCYVCKKYGEEKVEVRSSITQDQILEEMTVKKAITYPDMSRRGDIRLFHNLAKLNSYIRGDKKTAIEEFEEIYSFD